MKRYPFVIGATAAGLVGVLSFHTTSLSATAPSTALPSGAKTTSGTPSTTSPSTTSPVGSSATTTPSATPSTTPTAPSTTAPAQTESATGAVEQYNYGQLSVRVTISGGTITKVAIATLEVSDPRSQQIADEAIPTLEREVLDAQSATVSGVSGATYTSEAYALSVQSALDELGK